MYTKSDLVQQIQQYLENNWVCDLTYVPGKYHIKDVFNGLKLIISDKNLENQQYIY